MLSISSLSKSFGKKTIFRDFSYKFQERGIYAVCGRSGVGKTTLLRIICGLDANFSGTIFGAGKENTAVCFQEHRLFPTLSAKDNILKLSFRTSDEKTNEEKTKALLRRLRFTDSDMELYPEELSGGMRQRVAFARAVLRDAPILILDEATKELDSDIAAEVLDIIKEEGARRLVILVTHKDEEIERLCAERIILN